MHPQSSNHERGRACCSGVRIFARRVMSTPPNTVCKAKATLLRQQDLSGNDVQHVKMQDPWLDTAMVSSSLHSSANLVVHNAELLNSISCISMSRVPLDCIRDSSNPCPSKLSGLNKKENMGPYFQKSTNCELRLKFGNVLRYLTRVNAAH